ncbi:putative secondary metabolism biosynthetic enzyme [Claviceps digitariae]|nr:putative secondary metabolism biosynthetic enzyme [Claviceps digitariae]
MLGSICDKVSARLILSSVRQAELAAKLVGHVVDVGEEAMHKHMQSMTTDVNRHASELHPTTCSPGPRNVFTLSANVLGLAMNQVGADDNFFSLGGDSLIATEMVAMARKERLSLTVQNLSDRPRLSELAHLANVMTVKDKKDHRRPPSPVVLVAGPKHSIIRDAAYLDRLQQAWTAVAKVNPILRSRMIPSSTYGLLRIVVREDLWSMMQINSKTWWCRLLDDLWRSSFFILAIYRGKDEEGEEEEEKEEEEEEGSATRNGLQS